MSTNPIVHWEIMGADAAAQKSFYSDIFEWQFETPEGFESYYMTSPEGGPGGAVGRGSDEMPGYLTIYVEVADINETLGKVEASGGSTVVPRTEIPDTVIFAMFSDPGGNIVGLVEADSSGS